MKDERDDDEGANADRPPVGIMEYACSDGSVLRGGYVDERGEYTAGRFVTYEDGSVHSPQALPGDEACVLLAVAHEGILLQPAQG